MREMQLAAGCGTRATSLRHWSTWTGPSRLDPDNPRAYMLRRFLRPRRRELNLAESDARGAIRLLKKAGTETLLPEPELLGAVLLDQRYQEAIPVFEASAQDALNTALTPPTGTRPRPAISEGTPAPSRPWRWPSLVSRGSASEYFFLSQVYFDDERYEDARPGSRSPSSGPPMRGLPEPWRSRGRTREKLGQGETPFGTSSAASSSVSGPPQGRIARFLAEGSVKLRSERVQGAPSEQLLLAIGGGSDLASPTLRFPRPRRVPHDLADA